MHRIRAVSFAAVLAAAGGITGAFFAAAPARAQDCPGNPNAIGTSRVLAISPREYPRIGVMQYPDTLPLANKEVVLTFDDGPLPPYSNEILDILASQCVKATYFLVGEMASSFPATVRKIHEAGHAIGTHSENHPLRFEKLSDEKLRWEIDQGIADVGAALGDPTELAPFFRIPGLARSNRVEDELAERSLIVFSSDTVADDWHRHIRPADIISRAMSRLEKRGKGILLLHDIHKTTVAALPGLLKELKDHGFKIVQVVPAAPTEPSGTEIAGKSNAWILASAMPGDLLLDDDSTQPSWPQSSAMPMPDAVVLPAPDASAFDIGYPDGPSESVAFNLENNEVQWPNQTEFTGPFSSPQLPAPSLQDIGVPMAGRRVVGRLRDDRLHAHHHARAPATPDGQHADLATGIRALAALFTPRAEAH